MGCIQDASQTSLSHEHFLWPILSAEHKGRNQKWLSADFWHGHLIIDYEIRIYRLSLVMIQKPSKEPLYHILKVFRRDLTVSKHELNSWWHENIGWVRALSLLRRWLEVKLEFFWLLAWILPENQSAVPKISKPAQQHFSWATGNSLQANNGIHAQQSLNQRDNPRARSPTQVSRYANNNSNMG